MPITLPPLSRRGFLQGALAAGAAGVLSRWGFAADGPGVDPHRFALVSDIHVDADRTFGKMNAVPWDALAQVTREVLALPVRPAGVLVTGDLTHHQGNPEDYATLIDGLRPLREGGLPIHLAMGNHDHRANFAAALPKDVARQDGLGERQVCVVEGERANFVMLDSLDVVAKTPGAVGKEQLAWLTKALDARPDKPAIVAVHHDPNLDKKPKVTGLIDAPALLAALLPRKQVKALVFGHTHDWRHVERDGLHLVNLPSTAWVFQPGKARGWVDLTLAEAGGTFELRCLDPKHKQHGEKLALKWR
jgi:DNA repair exonuclease SbcCD nuclease subunit